MEGAGNAGRPMRPQAACAKVVCRRAHALVRSHRQTPGIPRAMVYSLYVISPVIGFLATVIPEKPASQELDASTEASEPHDLAVRFKRSRQQHHPRPPHPAPRFVTIASRPSSGTGPAQCELICHFWKSEYFLLMGLTEGLKNSSAICPTGQITRDPFPRHLARRQRLGDRQSLNGLRELAGGLRRR